MGWWWRRSISVGFLSEAREGGSLVGGLMSGKCICLLAAANAALYGPVACGNKTASIGGSNISVQSEKMWKVENGDRILLCYW